LGLIGGDYGPIRHALGPEALRPCRSCYAGSSGLCYHCRVRGQWWREEGEERKGKEEGGRWFARPQQLSAQASAQPCPAGVSMGLAWAEWGRMGPNGAENGELTALATIQK
jgi:hypothetical protein